MWADSQQTKPEERGNASQYMEDAHPDLQVTNWCYSPNKPEWFETCIRANRRKDYGGVYCNAAWTDKWGRICSASKVAPEYWFALPRDDIAPEGV